MSFRERFPATVWIWRTTTGRTARRVYLGIVLLALITSVIVRAHTYVLTRRMQAVIAGLSKLEIDKSTESDVVRTVPYLVRSPYGGQLKRSVETGDIDTGTAQHYYATLTNEANWMLFGRYMEPLVQCCVRTRYTKDGYDRSWLLTLANLMGYRYVYFSALVTLLDGKVSGISYGVMDRMGFPRPVFEIVSVKSAHSFYGPLQTGFRVQSTDDESPQFRVHGGEHGIGVTYTVDAPHELTAHAFQVDLSCFWALRRCSHARQVAPLLWQDEKAIQTATLTRLQSADPCPDRILTGRVRYLPDVGILLLESKGSRAERVTPGTQRLNGVRTDYRLARVLRGKFWKDMESVWVEDTIPFPDDYLQSDYDRRLPNRGLRWTNKGERVLAFSNGRFDSCGIVPVTPSALAAVQNAETASRRQEDELAFGLQ